MSKGKRHWQDGLKYIAGCVFLPWEEIGNHTEEYGRRELRDQSDYAYTMVWCDYSYLVTYSKLSYRWNILFDYDVCFATKEEAMEYMDKLILSHGGRFVDKKILNMR